MIACDDDVGKEDGVIMRICKLKVFFFTLYHLND